MLLHIDHRDTTDPHVNLALEEYCVRNLPPENDYLLVYINAACVIVGRHQNIFEEVDLNYARRSRIPVVRRISGGGAVYHDPGNVNYCIIRNSGRLGLARIEHYLRPVLTSLNRMGLAAEIDHRHAMHVQGRKISGTALFSNTRRVMVHGTLLFDADLETLDRVLRPPAGIIRSKSLKSVHSRVANLSEWMDAAMDRVRFSRRFLETLAAVCGGIRPYALSQRRWDAVCDLADAKYRSWRWNYAKAPDFVVHRIAPAGTGTLEIRIEVRGGIIQSIRCGGTPWPESVLRGLEFRLKGARYEPNEIILRLNHAALDALGPSLTPEALAAILC